MTTLDEIESAIQALPDSQKIELYRYLTELLAGAAEARNHSVLEIPPVRLGAVLRPLDSQDDLLGEMLADRS